MQKAEPTKGGSRAAQKRAKKRAREGGPVDEPPCQKPCATAASAASAEPAPSAAAAASSEWTIPMPAADSDLGEAIELARAQAATVTGRKYRYGAVLLADNTNQLNK